MSRTRPGVSWSKFAPVPTGTTRVPEPVADVTFARSSDPVPVPMALTPPWSSSFSIFAAAL
jgi:hypothetical protein